MTSQLTRLRLGLAAGAAAVATAAVLAASGSAQAPPSSLHLVSKAQKHVGFFPNHALRQGDRLGFGSRISGDDHGFGRAVCTVIGTKGGLLCTLQAQLSKGTLTAQGLLPERAHSTPIAITGGTGAYDGARGTLLVTDVNQNTSESTVMLLP
jgi:hypothetical protein